MSRSVSSVGHAEDCPVSDGSCRCRTCACCTHKTKPDACRCPDDCHQEST